MPTRGEALEHITKESSFRAVSIRDATTLRVQNTPDGLLTIRPHGRQALQVTERDAPAILSFAGVPSTLASALSPNTLSRVLTDSLRGKGSLTMLASNGNVVDIAPSGKYHPIDPERVFRSVNKSVPDFTIQTLRDLPKHTFSLELLGVNEAPVRAGGHAGVNDIIKAGVLVEFSPLGLTDPLVQSFCMRQICSNGAVATDVLRQFRFARGGGAGSGEGDDVWQFFRESACEAYRSIGRIVERYEQMQQEAVPADQRAMVLAALIKEAGLSDKAREALQARALQEPPETAYDVYNLLTWATSHAEQDPIRVRRAQNRAAEFVGEGTHHRLCPTCRRTR